MESSEILWIYDISIAKHYGAKLNHAMKTECSAIAKVRETCLSIYLFSDLSASPYQF